MMTDSRNTLPVEILLYVSTLVYVKFLHTSQGNFQFRRFGSFQLPSSVNDKKAL